MRDQTVSYRGEDTISKITSLIASLQGIIRKNYNHLSELLGELHPENPLKLRAMIIKADMEKSFEWLTLFTETPKEDIQTLLNSMLDQIDHKESILHKILQVLQSLYQQQQSLSSPSNTGKQTVMSRFTNAFKPQRQTQQQQPQSLPSGIEQHANELTRQVKLNSEREKEIDEKEEKKLNDLIKKMNDRINSDFQK